MVRRIQGYGYGFRLGRSRNAAYSYLPPGGGGGPAVQGDIIAATILADGWTLELTLKDFKIGGNQGRGRDANGVYPGTGTVTVAYDCDPFGTPKVTLSAGGRSGYDATTGAATSAIGYNTFASVAKRKAYSAGGAEQTNDETTSVNDAIIRLTLTNRVAAGETLTLSALANLYIDNGAGGSGLQSNAKTSMAVTNNSTWTIPKPICAFLTPARQRLGTVDFDFEFGVLHRSARNSRAVAAVEFTWTGRTSLVSVSKTITSMVLSGYFRASGPRACVFKATLTAAEIAGFTQAEIVDLKCEARPFHGPAFVSNTDGTAFPTTKMQQTIPFVCDKNNTLRAWATVDPAGALTSASTAGCTTTDTEQTSTANCYGNVNAAVQALYTFMARSELQFGHIYVRAGTYANYGTANNTTALAQGTGWLTIQKAPSTTRAAVIFTTEAGQSITGNGRRIGGHLRFKDVTLQTVATATSNDNVLIHGPDTTSTPSRAIWLDGCVVTSNSSHATPTSCISQYGEQYWLNNDGSGKLRMVLGSGKGYNLIAGNDFNNIGILQFNGPMVANKGYGGTQFNNWASGTLNSIQPDQYFYAHNEFRGANPVTVGWYSGSVVALPKGIGVVGNVTENFANASQAAFAISNDGDENVHDNFVVGFNTTAGERRNFGYNDSGTVSVAKDGVEFGNIDHQRFIKRDTFSHPTNGKQAARTGNWSISHAVDSRYNYTKIAQFGYSAVASNSDIGDAWHSGKIVATIAFASDLSGEFGAGNGDYRLVGTGTNDPRGVIASPLEWLPFTTDGVARVGDAGALSRS